MIVIKEYRADRGCRGNEPPQARIKKKRYNYRGYENNG